MKNLRSGKINLNGMIDNQIGRTNGIDFIRITAKFQNGISHAGKVDHRRHSSKIFQFNRNLWKRFFELNIEAQTL